MAADVALDVESMPSSGKPCLTGIGRRKPVSHVQASNRGEESAETQIHPDCPAAKEALRALPFAVASAPAQPPWLPQRHSPPRVSLALDGLDLRLPLVAEGQGHPVVPHTPRTLAVANGFTAKGRARASALSALLQMLRHSLSHVLMFFSCGPEQAFRKAAGEKRSGVQPRCGRALKLPYRAGSPCSCFPANHFPNDR